MASLAIVRSAILPSLAAAGTLTSSQVSAQGCEDLWYQRNRIFKEAGYCFRTPRGTSAFGNAGCAYGDERDVPLSGRERDAVAAIRDAERRLGCRP
ncbi:YARHG domain-containing protein [Methylobacterium sp. ID0610]|uniref:YARHG domain-containing protein n=1 Tax=Methylobacterium carpenticola TaxID=3344827 RepID=UPI0036BCF6F8